MNKFKLYFLLISVAFGLFSCSKSNNDIVPLRDYSVQYLSDNETIEQYLKTYYIETITDHPGYVDDQDIKFTKIPVNGTQPSIMSLLNSSTFPKLLSKDVTYNDIVYKVYYLKLF